MIEEEFKKEGRDDEIYEGGEDETTALNGNEAGAAPPLND